MTQKLDPKTKALLEAAKETLATWAFEPRGKDEGTMQPLRAAVAAFNPPKPNPPMPPWIDFYCKYSIRIGGPNVTVMKDESERGERQIFKEDYNAIREALAVEGEETPAQPATFTMPSWEHFSRSGKVEGVDGFVRADTKHMINQELYEAVARKVAKLSPSAAPRVITAEVPVHPDLRPGPRTWIKEATMPSWPELCEALQAAGGSEQATFFGGPQSVWWPFEDGRQENAMTEQFYSTLKAAFETGQMALREK